MAESWKEVPPVPSILRSASLGGTPGQMVGTGAEQKDKMKQKEMQFQLVGAIERQDIQLLLSLIERGVNLNAVILYAKTPLTYALELGYSDIACRLIRGGCDVEKTMATEMLPRPIHLAVLRFCPNVVKVLLECGAEVNSRDGGQSTAMHYAAYFGFTDIVSFLLSNKADVNAKDDVGRTPLHRAIEKGHLEIATLLIEHECCVNTQDINGWPPLFQAVIFGDLKCVEYLLQKNCRLDLRDRHGNGALHLACDRVSPTVIRILLGTSIEVQKRKRRIPTAEVTELIQRGVNPSSDMIRLLVNSGICVNSKNASHETPLYLLAFNKHLTLATFLFFAGGRIENQWLHMYSELPPTAGYKGDYLAELQTLYGKQIELTHQCRGVIRECLCVTRDINSSLKQLTLPLKLLDFIAQCDLNFR